MPLLAAALALAFLSAGDRPLDLNAEVTRALEPIRTKYDLPALAGAIVTENGLKAIAATGVRKRGSPVLATASDRFHLGSNTKAMTAALIAVLVSQGKLRWDSTMAEVFPELKDRMDPACRRITVELLLVQRSGFEGSYPKGMSGATAFALKGTPREQRAQYVKKLLEQPPTNKLNEKFVYSNINYVLAGAIAERLCNDSYENLMNRLLFNPLGMTSVGWGAMGKPGAVEQPWQHLASGQAVEPGPRSDNPPLLSPAGRLHCSLADWSKFIAENLKGRQGKSKLLSKAVWKRLHTPPSEGSYALGWMALEREWAGGETLAHSGSNNMNFSVAWMAPKKGFAVLVVTNQGGETAAKACDEAASALIRLHIGGSSGR